MTSGVAEEGIEVQEGKIRPVSMEDWAARIKARLLYGIPNQRALVCEGEAGCGKSEITAQICTELGLPPVICPGLGAQQMEEFLAMVKVVDAGNGSAKILQAVHDNLIPTQDLVDSGKYTIKVNGKPRTVVPWIVDEFFTGNMGQMNQLRGFLTFRQSGSVKIPRETIIIGTTNPEDVAYSSRRAADAAIMERVEVIRVKMSFKQHQEYLSKEERNGRYPSVCRLFLRMEEQQDMWNLASPRFWHQGFGLGWMELSMCEDMPQDQKIRLFEQNLMDAFQQITLKNKQRRSKEKLPMTAQALIGRFQNFIKHGDDPHYYPISCNKILEAGQDTKLAAEHRELFKHWKSNGAQNYIGVTVQDMATGLCTVDELHDKQAKHIVSLLNYSGVGLSSQFIRTFYQEHKETEIGRMLISTIAKDPELSKVIADAIVQFDTLNNTMRESRKKAKKSSTETLLS